jgi:hypothetical protein
VEVPNFYWPESHKPIAALHFHDLTLCSRFPFEIIGGRFTWQEEGATRATMACATARYMQVYALTPRETEHYEMAGMTVIPTQPEELAARLAELKVGTGIRL